MHRPQHSMIEVHLPRSNRDIQAILSRSQRTNPSIIISTRWVIRIIKVEYDTLSSQSAGCRQEIASFDSIKEIAPTSVALCRAGSIAEMQEETASINIQPVERQRHRLALNAEMQPPHCCHAHRFFSVHSHSQECWLNIGINISYDTHGRIIGEVIQAPKTPPLFFI